MFGKILAFMVVAASLLISSGAFAGCSYTPFDFKVVKATEYPGLSKQKGDLPFAQGVAFDASTVWSEPPFYRQETNAGKVVWGMDTKHDSLVASQNTMLEIFGQLRDHVGYQNLNPKWFLTEENMEKFNGVSSSDIALYPGGNHSGQVRESIKSVFGEYADRVLYYLGQKNQKAAKEGRVHYARPSYLSSNNLQNKSLVLACMLTGYTSSIYDAGRMASATPTQRAEDHEVSKHVLRSSIIDLVAAETSKALAAGKDISKLEVPFAADQAKCRLVQDFRYRLQPTTGQTSNACTTVSQSVPVIRNGPESWNDQRLIQWGTKIYKVMCWVNHNHEWVNFSDKTARPANAIDNIIAALGNDPGLVNSPVGQQIRDHLGHLIRPNDTKESREFFQQTANQCSTVLNHEILHPPTPASYAYLQDQAGSSSSPRRRVTHNLVSDATPTHW